MTRLFIGTPLDWVYQVPVTHVGNGAGLWFRLSKVLLNAPRIIFNMAQMLCTTFRSIIPEWDEILTFNESTSYIIKPSTVIFFEIVDFIDSSNSNADYTSVGWHHVAWAFLKPFGKNNVSNVEKMVRLQLYYARAKSTPSASNSPCVSTI